MPLRPILRLLLAGLLAGSGLLAPWPGEGSYTPPLRVGYEVAHADGPGDWPMFGHDPAHTGYNAEETQLKPPLRLKWSYEASRRDGIYSSPAVSNGVVYVGSSAKVYALETATGAMRWSYTTGDVVHSSPAVADGVVYVGSHDRKVYALEATTGALRWSYATGGSIISSPAVSNGVVYVGSYHDGKVYALEAATGALRWSYTTGFYVWSSPAVSNGVVYVGSLDGKLYALEAASGALLWSYTAGDWVYSSPSVANGVVYVASAQSMSVDGKVHALEAATGALRWSYTTGGRVRSSPAVADGVVYVGSNTPDGKVYALDSATGALRWSYTTGDSVESSPAVANGVVYVGSGDGKVYGLEAATGTLLWSYTTGARDTSSPAVANGVVYVGSQDGKLYAFETQPPLVSVPLAAYQTAGASFPISWTVPVTWTGTAAGSYDVQYRDGPSGAWTDVVTSTTSTSTTFSGQDGHTYYYRARSRTAAGALGDWSDATSTTVDLTAPTGTLQAQGWSSPYISNTITLSISASDATSGLSQMQFGSDGLTFGAWDTYTTTRSYVAPPGATAVYGRFKDGAGNISQPVTGSVTLDASPPAGSLQTQGWSSPHISNTVTLSVAASDATSGLSQMQFGPNSETFNPWESYGTASLYLAPPGATAVFGRFKDRAQNVSTPVSATVTVDATPPTGSLVLNGGTAYTNQHQVTAELSASDDLSGVSQVAFSNDGATYEDWRGYSSRFSVTVLQGDGEKTLFAHFRDQAGNVSIPASDTIILDTTPPTTPAPDDGLTGAISSPTVTLQWPASSDALSGMERYYYKADCGSETATSALTATTSLLPDGDHTFYVRARDQIGNYSPYGKHALTIRATGLDPPDMYAPDSPTDRDRVNVSGVGLAKNPVRLYLNCNYYGETTSGSFGGWQFRDVPLALGENVIVASMADSGGGLSPISLPAVVVRLKALGSSPIKSATSLLTPSGGAVSAGRHGVEVPAGALPGETQVVVTPYGAEAALPLVGKRSVGAFASITARERGTGAPAQLQKAVRISLGYDPQALGGVSPSQLAVNYYDPQTSAWVAMASQVDTANRLVTAETDHLSDFALLADLPPLPVRVYLPLVATAISGW